LKNLGWNLYCGNEQDFYQNLLCKAEPVRSETEISDCMPQNWAVVHACKEPFHRMALQYAGRGCPKDHPDYLWSERSGNRLALNMVDVPNPSFFDKRMIDKALDFIEKKLDEGLNVLVHCNEGFSRSPSICLLYLLKHGKIKGDTLDDCITEFTKVYREYNPGIGIRGFLEKYWEDYSLNIN